MENERGPENSSEFNFSDVDITNDLMFSTVMQDEALCIELLEYLLPDKKIQRLKYRYFDDEGAEVSDAAGSQAQVQKTMLGYFGQRGVRLDAFVDDGTTVYNIELQTTREAALPQRSRLLQSHMDISQLMRGQNYDELRPSFVIFICTFDPFHKDYYRYTFRNMCEEESGLPLDDGAYKLFFNTTGHMGDISPNLRELLKYMSNTQAYPVVESKNDLIRKLDAAVAETKMKPVWRDAYMMYQMKMREVEIRGEAKGRKEGEARGRKEIAVEVAKRMLQEPFPVDMIARISGLPVSEINALKAQANRRDE